jgi:N-acetylmuramoyl-L-alanine amidase
MSRIFPFIAGLMCFFGASTDLSGQGTPAKKKAEKQVVLVLDPGHGGHDRGAVNGQGFDFLGQNVSEGAYTYDVAKRVERLAKEESWKIVFTITREERDSVFDFNEDSIIGGSEKIRFNLPLRQQVAIRGKELLGRSNEVDRDVVTRGRDGLAMRVAASKNVLKKYPGATVIFISIHFDYADSVFSGARIFAPAGAGSHPFVQALKKSFTEAELQLVKPCKCSGYQFVNATNYYYLLREGVVRPRVLVELGNFNHETDRMRMLRYESREQYAEAIVRAVEAFVSKK